MEDYYKYLRSIDDLTESKTGKEKPAAFEILGLNYDELASIENNVFRKEYEKINLEEVLKISQIGLDQPKDDYKLLRCDYIKQAMSSLGDDEKSSIEEDIKSKTALVFEEDIDEIEERLHYQKMKTDEIPEGELHDDDNTGVQDISDKVVIIDDENDLQRYIESFPADKQANLKRLLKYLDGLFEKLPEDVINNFANSEYFELYSKVLDDLDV